MNAENPTQMELFAKLAPYFGNHLLTDTKAGVKTDCFMLSPNAPILRVWFAGPNICAEILTSRTFCLN